MNKIVEPVKEKEESSTLPLEFIVGELKRVEGEEFAYLSDLLVKQTAGLAYKLAYGKLGKRELAEDAVQDAYELVFLKLHQLRDPSAFKSWFCRIVVHCCHKHFCTKPDFEEPADPERPHEKTVMRATLATPPLVAGQRPERVVATRSDEFLLSRGIGDSESAGRHRPLSIGKRPQTSPGATEGAWI